MNTQCREPKKLIGIATIIPVTVAIFAFIIPGDNILFIIRLVERLIVIATEYTIAYLINCFVTFPDLARKVMFRFIIKFNDNAIIRARVLEIGKFKNRKKRLNDKSSTVAPDAPAKQNDKNFFLTPILMNCEIDI